MKSSTHTVPESVRDFEKINANIQLNGNSAEMPLIVLRD